MGRVRWRRRRPAVSYCTLGQGVGAGDYPRLGFVMICTGINTPKLRLRFLCSGFELRFLWPCTSGPVGTVPTLSGLDAHTQAGCPALSAGQ